MEGLADYADVEALADAGGGGGMSTRRARHTKRRVVKRQWVLFLDSARKGKEN